MVANIREEIHVPITGSNITSLHTNFHKYGGLEALYTTIENGDDEVCNNGDDDQALHSNLSPHLPIKVTDARGIIMATK